MPLVKFHGLAFVPCETAEIALEQGQWVPITKVISRAFAGLGLQDPSYEPALDWMQASFTAQADRTYTGLICTRQDPQKVEFAAGSYRGNALLTQLRSALPGHFLPKSGAIADQKRRRRRGACGRMEAQAQGVQECMQAQA